MSCGILTTMGRWLVVITIVFACGDKDAHTVDDGKVGGHCYPNGTCNVGLSCFGGICVVPDAVEIDADVDAPLDAAINAPIDSTPDANCEPISTTPPSGHHNPGMGCRSAAGCHNAQLGLGTAAPEYSVAGTVYKTAAGTMPYPGATILITMGGTTNKVIAADNGNFWLVPAIQPAPSNASTAMVSASACPNTVTMTAQLVGGGGDCNSANCHAPGGAQGAVFVTP